MDSSDDVRVYRGWCVCVRSDDVRVYRGWCVCVCVCVCMRVRLCESHPRQLILFRKMSALGVLCVCMYSVCPCLLFSFLLQLSLNMYKYTCFNERW